MTTYLEEASRKLGKDKLIGIALSLESKMKSPNAYVLEELTLLDDKYEKIEAGMTYKDMQTRCCRLVYWTQECSAGKMISTQSRKLLKS